MDKQHNEFPSPYDDFGADRGAVEVKSRTRKKKTVVVVFLAVMVVAIVISSAGFALYRYHQQTARSSQTTAETGEDSSGIEKRNLNDGSHWLLQVKEEKRRKDESEKQRQAKADQERLAREEAERRRKATQATAQQHAPVPQPKPVVTKPATSGKSEQITPEVRKMSGDLMLVSDSAAATHQPVRQEDSGTQSGLFGGGESDAFHSPTYRNGIAYQRSRKSRDFLLQHGTVIPCALYTQIISDYQGYLTCRVTKDVYSANGAALLVERGSMLTGNQQMKLEAGKNRIFTTWGDVETTQGIHIDINSLGAGRLGASGNHIWVDNHYAQRFGGAILLSFMDDVFDALSNKISDADNHGVSFSNSTDTANNIAQEALKNSINISPTGYTKIGQKINILVARDVDMSGVYGFE
ncbi:type IV secretion system protein VirB10 [Vibrio aerogenes]|uniref:type IV secretion system protein VirB10 n=1 Tax=Vibrio aerogenes TaxID=92172 RepID=UPI0021C46A3A|nr:type IV secretion system protein VirB10 [Vibrio aerogenes]